MWGNHMMSGGFMWIFWIIMIIGFILLIRWVIQQSRSNDAKRSESALEILKKRYAEGEIDEEEFKQKKKDLIG